MNEEIQRWLAFDPDALTQEVALKLLLAGVGGVALASFAIDGLRTMEPEQRKQVAMFTGAVALAWGIKNYFDLDKQLEFAINVEAEPPASWAELEAAVRAQAAKSGIAL